MASFISLFERGFTCDQKMLCFSSLIMWFRQPAPPWEHCIRYIQVTSQVCDYDMSYIFLGASRRRFFPLHCLQRRKRLWTIVLHCSHFTRPANNRYYYHYVRRHDNGLNVLNIFSYLSFVCLLNQNVLKVTVVRLWYNC